MTRQQLLGQWMTPAWAAAAIVEHALPKMPDGTVILEPSCGNGRFLAALPQEYEVIGVEIDPDLAEEARKTGRPVIEGDFRRVDLPYDKVDAIIGNPPFALDVFDGMLARSRDLLELGSEAIFILPAYAFQTASRVTRWNKDWTIAQEMMPRNLFPGIRLPITLARFIRERNPRLHGLFLYHETESIGQFRAVYKKALETQQSGWLAVVQAVLEDLGGEADIAAVCQHLAQARPTSTVHWQAKVRQQLQNQEVFKRVARGRYRLAA